MYQGIYDIGVGVSDMGKALQFYRDDLGFSTVLFDNTGDIPDLAGLASQKSLTARIVLLENPSKGSVGVGRIRLVQLLEPIKAAPLPKGIGWGEIGVAEVSLQVSNIGEITAGLTDQKGCALAMPVAVPPTQEGGRRSLMSYVLDPEGGKVELIEFPGEGETENAIYGVFHVAIGVTDIVRSKAFYQSLGLTEPIWSMEGVIPEMVPWHGKAQEMRITMLSGGQGGCIELVQQIPKTRDCRGLWGHLGPMDFSIQVTDLKEAMYHMRQQGIAFCGDPQILGNAAGEWKYAYFVEPDGNYVSLVEAAP